MIRGTAREAGPGSEVLVLQHVEPEGPGLIARALDGAGLGLRTVRLHRGDPVPGSPDGAAAVVSMGGPMGVHDGERFPFLAAEKRLLEQALRRRVPVLGVCLGAQLLADVLGAPVRTADAAEIGWHRVRLTGPAARDPVWSRAPEQFHAFHWHGDVFDLPDGAANLARSDATAHQAYRYGEAGDLHAYGILFHLEMTRAILEGMIHAFPDELASAGVSPGQLKDESTRWLTDLQRIGDGLFRRWARRVRTRGAPPRP